MLVDVSQALNGQMGEPALCDRHHELLDATFEETTMTTTTEPTSTTLPTGTGTACAEALAAPAARADIARIFFRLITGKDITAWAELWHPDAVISVP
jgi:hypothetical protein